MIKGRTTYNIFEDLVSAYWLRPESAVWYSHMLYMADQFIGVRVDAPFLDFGCMDGVNSFVLQGGKLGRNFDIYEEVDWKANSIKSGGAVHDYFNCVKEEDFEVEILSGPERTFDYGVDWKEAHIIKSKRLKVHKDFLTIDLEFPKIPLLDNSISCIWAPNIYWSPNIDATLSELSRILKTEGRIITIGPDTNQLSYMLTRFEGSINKDWIADMDRGRFINSKRHSRSLKDWDLLFAKHGLSISREEGFISPLVAMSYDIGFRPFFPVFMEIYEKVKKHSLSDWLELKNQWIETISHFARPLCEKLSINDESKAAWHIFELKLKK